jgi:hypothetical protein
MGYAKGHITDQIELEEADQTEIRPPRWRPGTSPEPAEASGTVEKASLQWRYKDSEKLNDCLKNAIDDFAKTEGGSEFIKNLPKGVTLQDLIQENRSTSTRDVLSYIANVCERAGVDHRQTGNLVHRVAEMRTLHQHPYEVLNGIRMVEQRIDYIQDGEHHHAEVDTVIVRGEQHYIRDYKPINLEDFETTEIGQEWSKWMNDHVGADYQTRLKMGENPFRVGQPIEMRHGLRDFLKESTAQYKQRLNQYKEIYQLANELDSRNVHVSVRPYFVYR